MIGDLVGSRRIPDRRTAHEALARAFEVVGARVPALQPLAPTVGDEFQALYPDVAAALRATLALRLALGAGLDARFGIGAGWHESFAVRADATPLHDGSAWWAAREAIDRASAEQSQRSRSARGWYVAAAEAASSHPPAGLVNAYLLARDELVTPLDDRARRLMLGTLLGRTQAQLADAEGITQSAVSRSLQRNGAFALIDGIALLGG